MPCPSSTLPGVTVTRPSAWMASHCDRRRFACRLPGRRGRPSSAGSAAPKPCAHAARAFPHRPRGALHRADDPVVAAAAAEMRVERAADRAVVRIGLRRQQRRGRDQDAGQAPAALPRLLGEEGGLQAGAARRACRAPPPSPPRGRAAADTASVQAGHRLAVHQHHAAPALLRAAAEARAGQPERPAQRRAAARRRPAPRRARPARRRRRSG